MIRSGGVRRGEIEYLGKLLLPFRGEVVADQDEGQVGVGQQALFHDVGVFLVQRAGALVHQKDGAVVDQGPGDGDPLLLASGEIAAFFAYHGVQAVGHGGEVANQRAVPQGPFHLLVGECLPQGDVVPDGRIKEEDVLLDVAHLGLKLLGGEASGVFSIEADRPAVVRQPAQEEL